ncbi:hypothetical protein DID88_009419 [Monilinia fructigena]|uniref:Heme haloperoxidase family profile domain-containing protein n=1 Tax=Monilinia fructigena TaxID=38457 RepID=A0A395IMJ1_9HELO|nr:hypothetical protein DID88_009419 [Monilinia fructigena]
MLLLKLLMYLGAHAFVPPGPNDLGSDLAVFLVIYGLVMDGNPISLNPGWSAPQGLIGSHNKYEGDTSPTRGDLFVYGNSWKLQIPQFQELFDLQPDAATANYDIRVMAQLRKITFERSVRTNPYFFYGPLFMANHTAEYPEGILDQFNLKSFFGITGESGAFVKKDGWERIPFGWGKRAIGDEYGIVEFAEDILYFTSEYPNTITVGGNTGTVNSFTPIDFSDLTSGVYDIPTLLSENNIACFLLQTAQLTAPDILKGLFADITEPLGILTEMTGGLLSSLGSCPQLQEVDTTRMSIFPGSGATL